VKNDLACPRCGQPLSTAEEKGWVAPGGEVLPWVLYCVNCTTDTGEDWTYGLDRSNILIRADAYTLE
jgi:hypothetical protein